MFPFAWVSFLLNMFERVDPAKYFDREKMQSVVMGQIAIINPKWSSLSPRVLPFAELATYDIGKGHCSTHRDKLLFKKNHYIKTDFCYHFIHFSIRNIWKTTIGLALIMLLYSLPHSLL